MAQVTGVAGLVLAGGRSRRFGSNKALADWRGRPMVQAVVEAVMPHVDVPVVVAKDPSPFAWLSKAGVRLVEDHWGDAHAMGGVVSGLRAVEAPRALVCACDMPQLRFGVLAGLLALAEDDALTVPVWEGIPQMLCAVYPRSILPTLETMIASGELRLRDALERAPVSLVPENTVRAWDPRGLSFQDLDTREAYELALFD